MGFLSGILGTKNEYQAHAPVNGYQAPTRVQQGTIDQAAAQAAGGAGPAQDTIQRQSALNDQLQAAANGQGPNPALEQLNQTTSQNVNRAAGTVASQRGINPALAARMALDSGASANQAAAGQAATMNAQQQIAARQQLGQNLSATGQTQLGQQAVGTEALGTAGRLGLGADQLNAGVANQNAALDLGAQQINAGVASQNAGTNAGIVGGILGGIGASAAGIPFSSGGGGAGAGAAMAAAYGGQIPALADGGAVPGGSLHDYLAEVQGSPPPVIEPWMADGRGYVGAETPMKAAPAPAGGSSQPSKAMGDLGASFKQAGDAGQAAYQRATARPAYGAAFANGGSIYADPAGKVPGKAEVPGDDPRNDKVHTLLSPGEIVIPRSIVNGKNAAKKAASFVASVMKRSGGSKRLAAGGRVGVQDMSEGGLVLRHPPPESKGAEAKPHTGRGLARDETRRRIKKAAAPKPETE